MSRLAIAAAVCAASLGAARSAAAEDKADCAFLEFTATTTKDGGVDPDLRPIEKQFKHPPYVSWNTFKRLTKLDKTLTKQKPETLVLKSGTATVILRERTDKRVNLGLTVDGADGKRVLDAKPDVPAGGWLVVGESVSATAGASSKDDGHFLALTCK